MHCWKSDDLVAVNDGAILWVVCTVDYCAQTGTCVEALANIILWLIILLLIVSQAAIMDLTNFQTAIRADAQTQQGSILDVIRLINPNLSSGNAANTFKVMTTWMTIKHSHILINGKGKLTR
jgi:hypothetical protein